MTLTLKQRRGYLFERAIVDSLNESDQGWDAKRLGGTTTTMPDIAANNLSKKTFFAIECKSTQDYSAKIEKEQIDRCIKMTQSQPYKNKYVVFAFKFKKMPLKNNKSKPLTYAIYGFKDLKIGDIDQFIAKRQGIYETWKQMDDHWAHLGMKPVYTFKVDKPESLAFVI
ncbi:MAG TPA: hypothetical protein VFX18_03275 [Candidatus Nitrosocosmicus sp.]|nr:hypothetical protein [Candidatus Nitrosocosmicus sp.]